LVYFCVTNYNLTGVTALPAGKTIETANPNALVTTSTDLGLTNKTNVVIGKTCKNLVITDGQSFATDKKFTATNASYSRTMNNAWGTICLPYAVTSDATAAYYKIAAINNGTLTIEKYETLPAGTPALVKKLSEGEFAPTAASVAVKGGIETVSGAVTMHGAYAKTNITDANAYYIKNNQFWQCNGNFNCGAFRAYFTVDNEAKSFSISEDELDAINALVGESDISVDAIYDANGAQRNDLEKGLNIVKLSNGKVQKIMVK